LSVQGAESFAAPLDRYHRPGTRQTESNQDILHGPVDADNGERWAKCEGLRRRDGWIYASPVSDVNASPECNRRTHSTRTINCLWRPNVVRVRYRYRLIKFDTIPIPF